MNKETTELLQQLANKLGTTTEYLWGVLIKQAPIDATTTLVQFILLGLFGFGLLRMHKRFLSRDSYDGYGFVGDFPAILMSVSVIVWALLVITGFFCIGDVVNGFFNPEYWALNKVMDKLR